MFQIDHTGLRHNPLIHFQSFCPLKFNSFILKEYQSQDMSFFALDSLNHSSNKLQYLHTYSRKKDLIKYKRIIKPCHTDK